jgi:hypothetical protein
MRCHAWRFVAIYGACDCDLAKVSGQLELIVTEANGLPMKTALYLSTLNRREHFEFFRYGQAHAWGGDEGGLLAAGRNILEKLTIKMAHCPRQCSIVCYVRDSIYLLSNFTKFLRPRASLIHAHTPRDGDLGILTGLLAFSRCPPTLERCKK